MHRFPFLKSISQFYKKKPRFVKLRSKNLLCKIEISNKQNRYHLQKAIYVFLFMSYTQMYFCLIITEYVKPINTYALTFVGC